MLTVYKYPLRFNEYTTVEMPANAKVLAFRVQRSLPFIWALVDTTQPKTEQRRFRMCGTGHPIDEPSEVLDYVGTAEMSGELIFHLFEVVAVR
jgi:hypothetical protein